MARRIKLRHRYATFHACECGQEWEVFQTHRGASSCPECDRMAPAFRVYDMHRDRLSFPLRRKRA